MNRTLSIEPVGADGLTASARGLLREARRLVAEANRSLARSGSPRRYAVLVADAPHAGRDLFVEPPAVEEVA